MKKPNVGDFFWNYGGKYGNDRHAVFLMHTPINSIEPFSLGYMFSVFLKNVVYNNSQIKEFQWQQK